MSSRASSPNLVTALLNSNRWLSCVGEQRLRGKAEQLRVGEGNRLVELLRNPRRMVPIVLVSCERKTNQPKLNTARLSAENTDTKLLIYGLFQKGRVLAQDGLMTPAAVHYGRADELNAARRQVLLEAHRAHPERFVHGTPQPPVLPRQVWINPPPEKTTPQEALGTTFSGHPIPELPPDSSYPDAIASEPNRDRTALTPRPSLIEAH